MASVIPEFHVVNWGKFQHYTKRNPPWIKNHMELLHKDEYWALSAADRGYLHAIWLVFAARPQNACTITAEHVQKTCRMPAGHVQRVLKRLNDAGFIAPGASTVVTNHAIPEGETERENPLKGSLSLQGKNDSTPAALPDGAPALSVVIEQTKAVFERVGRVPAADAILEAS